MKINQKGQSILEVAVSLGLIMVIVTILTITTINGLKNSQFAKNQVLASSYAEQGIELIKYARQRDCRINIAATPGVGPYYWADRSGGKILIWEYATNPIPAGNAYAFEINTAAPCTVTQTTITNLGQTINTIFTRKIKLERLDPNINTIRVTASVNWTDYTGEHTVENVSIVTNY